MGTGDGMAKYPYVRESRRIKAHTTVLEQHCGVENRMNVLGLETARATAKRYRTRLASGIIKSTSTRVQVATTISTSPRFRLRSPSVHSSPFG